jgi:hypothetical protein
MKIIVLMKFSFVRSWVHEVGSQIYYKGKAHLLWFSIMDIWSKNVHAFLFKYLRPLPKLHTMWIYKVFIHSNSTHFFPSIQIKKNSNPFLHYFLKPIVYFFYIYSPTMSEFYCWLSQIWWGREWGRSTSLEISISNIVSHFHVGFIPNIIFIFVK